ncbi:MAG: phosphate ABC transporter permease PstA, partial [Actinomycetota bacterium]
AQDSLPLYVYGLKGSSQAADLARMWTGALVLIALVLALFVITRIAGGRAVGERRRKIRIPGLRRSSPAEASA